MQLLTKKYLTSRNACKAGINLAERNGLLGLPIDWLLKNSQGDFGGFKCWLENQQRTEYTYDSHGNMLTKTDPGGYVFTYAYDQHGNMLTMTYPDGGAYTYTYDSHGNMLTMTHPDGDVYTYIYDKHGNMLTMTDPYGDVYTYTYDQHGNMLTITHPNGKVYTCTYEHWPNGQLKRANDLFIDLYEGE